MEPLVYITGASSGIGQALAAAYAQAGWRLALVARRGEEMAQWARGQGLDPQRWRVFPADVGEIDSIVAAGEACRAEFGLPDVVIANAGISFGVDTALREDLDVVARLYAVNNIGLAATFQPFVGPMRRRGSGRLVGIASVAGIRGLPGHAAYSSSKSAVITYCESLRGELRGSGVRVVTIAPGYIDTPLTQQNRFPMPFLMAADDFARAAMREIERGSSYRVIPWQMGVVAKLLRVLPDGLFDRVMARQPRKHRSS